MYIRDAFSSEKLLIYNKWVGSDKSKSVALCTLNMLVAESLYPAIHIFEDTLHDKINCSLNKHIGKNWCFHDRVKFTSNHERLAVNSKLAKLRKKNSEKNANRLFVSEANLFYWTNILNPINKHLWNKGIKEIFKSDTEVSQLYLFNKINQLRKLRNQIAHHNPIIDNDLEGQYDDCREILGMLSEDALNCCDLNSRFWGVHPRVQIIEDGILSPKVDLIPWMQFKME